MKKVTQMKKSFLTILLLMLLITTLLAGCVSSGTNLTLNGSSSTQPNTSTAAATSASHSKASDPNYAVVFPQDAVNRIDITLSAEAWAALQAEMTDEFGAQGQGGQAAGGPGLNPPQGGPPAGGLPGNGGQPGGGGMPALDFGETSYVSSTVTFNGEVWQSVGFRYSGNSTLQSSWKSGTLKISFRLDFDEYEDEDPTTTDQRFYGLKQLSFKSNAMDSSYLREKVVADIFRDSGVAASQTAFYAVYVDYGQGAQYVGLYTAVEVVDDTVIETQFADDSGNVYKPEGSGAAFVQGTFAEESFEKQTNQKEADWSDIQAVFAALNSDLRTSSPAAWRAGLEAVLDVDTFLRWLAVDTIVQNWDTYGAMAHNYYLYTDPTDGKVTWIPWDNNMALSATSSGPGGGRGGSVRSLDLSGVSSQWPLIRYLADDPTYLAKYQQYLAETIQGAFQPAALAETYQKYHALIALYVQQEAQGATQLASLESFNGSVDGLIQHAQSRSAAVQQYLAGK